MGTQNFGWQLDLAEAREVLDSAAEAGITFIDTADAYPGSEDIVGQLLQGRRDDFILATKGGGPVGQRVWDNGASRKHLLDAIDASLTRLRTDYVDIYFPHLYDPLTPLDETLLALDAIVSSGKARYIGASNYLAYQLARALGRSALHNTTQFVCTQTRYNLLSREAEKELAPLCQEEGLGVLAYNPLAGGLLTGKHNRIEPPQDDTRFGSKAGPFGTVYRARYWHEEQFDTVTELTRIAGEAGLDPVTMSVAFTLELPALAATIVGASNPRQLGPTLAALDLRLESDLISTLRSVTHRWRNGE
ncbi:aldo/keto reductase [Nocardia sp. NPDC001965]